MQMQNVDMVKCRLFSCYGAMPSLVIYLLNYESIYNLSTFKCITVHQGTNRSLLCFPFCSRERNVRATEFKDITDSLGFFHAVDSSFQVPEFTFLVSGTWIQASQSFAEFQIPQAKIFQIRESGSPDIGRTIQIRG